MSLCRGAIAGRYEERRRIKAYTLGGKWVCLGRIGFGEDFGTLPMDFIVQYLTGEAGWVEILRAPEAEELVQEGVHWQRIEPVW